jgi:2-methylisocitrate lyase-like PEP mutase family enzyme
MVEGGKTPILTAKELQDIGYSIATFPLSTLYAAAWGVRAAMRELYTKGTTSGYVGKMVTFNEFNALVGLEKVRETESYYYKDLFEKLATEKKKQ